MNILFFGDSLTAGYGLSNAATESLPALLQQKINAENLNYHVINAGVSGDTSSGGLNRIDYWLSQPISVFILELGANDIIRGVPPSLTAKNLQAIISKVKAKYPQVKMALMGMQLPGFIPGAYAMQFRVIFQQLSDANQMALVPFFLDGVAGHAHLNLPDGIHPTAKGYHIIIDKIWPVIKSIL